MTVIVVSHNQSVLDKMYHVIDLAKDSRECEVRMREYFKVNYFDLGMHQGQEIDAVVKMMRQNLMISQLNIYGIDANPLYYERALQKYKDHDRVKFHLFHFAVASTNGRTKLYFHPDDLGHSIYPDKWRVTSEGIEVPCMKFSDWLKRVSQKDERTFNILKANIEGAEWDLVNDLHQNGLLGYFDLYLGSQPGRFSDIAKITSLREGGALEKHHEILTRNHIGIRQFCHSRPNHQDNVDLNRELTRYASKLVRSDKVETTTTA